MGGTLLQEFLVAQEVELEKAQHVLLHQWHPPNLDVHKVNFDAAVFKASNSVGIGVVVRDWRDKVVGALSRVQIFCLTFPAPLYIPPIKAGHVFT